MGSEEVVISPAEELPASWEGTVSKSHKQTELLLRQLGWMAASLNLLPGSERGAPHCRVDPCTVTKHAHWAWGLVSPL